MRIENSSMDCIRIFDAPALDPLILLLRDDGGSGQVIVECYGEAWSTWFGSIGDRTLRDFLAGVHPEYLANRFERSNERNAQYVLRIAEAVIAAIKANPNG